MKLKNVIVEFDHRLYYFAPLDFDLADLNVPSKVCAFLHSFNVILNSVSRNFIHNVLQIGAGIDVSLFPKRQNNILIHHIQSALLDLIVRYTFKVNTSDFHRSTYNNLRRPPINSIL